MSILLTIESPTWYSRFDPFKLILSSQNHRKKNTKLCSWTPIIYYAVTPIYQKVTGANCLNIAMPWLCMGKFLNVKKCIQFLPFYCQTQVIVQQPRQSQNEEKLALFSPCHNNNNNKKTKKWPKSTRRKCATDI